jgi:hypothetical protein
MSSYTIRLKRDKLYTQLTSRVINTSIHYSIEHKEKKYPQSLRILVPQALVGPEEGGLYYLKLTDSKD